MWNYVTKALPWDLVIVLLLAGGIALVFLAWRKRHWRISIRVISAFLGLLCSGVIFYGSFIEPQYFTVTEGTVTLPTVNDLKIVVLGDMHVGPYHGENFVRRIVDRVNALQPDLVLLVGDYVYHATDPLDRLKPLADLQAPLGVFGILGNHEYDCYIGHVPDDHYSTFDASQKVMRALERVGVRILINESVEVPLPEGGPLFIAGIDDACSAHDSLESALPQITQKSSIILLAHDPSVILDQRTTYAHLILSGHTHGGQIRLPFIGSLVRLPIQIDQSYDQGFFPIDGNTTLAITRGLGEAGPRARLFAPPEILMVRVSSK